MTRGFPRTTVGSMLARTIRWSRPSARRSHRGRGQVMVVFAVGLVGLVAMLGLVVDGGVLYLQRRTAQNGADAAALAGAYALQVGAAGAADTTVATGVCTYVLANRSGPPPTATAVFVDAQLNAVGTIRLTGDCTGPQPGSTVPGTATGVRVLVTIGPYGTYLVGIVGVNTLLANATATASLAEYPAPQTVVALDPSTCDALFVDGGSQLTVQSGGIQVNSNCPAKAFEVAHGSIVTTSRAPSVVGGVSISGASIVSQAPVAGTVASDPLASIPLPDVAAGLVAKPSVDCNAGTMALSPGMYQSIKASHACLLTFMPGNYIIGDFNLDYGFVTIGNASTNTTIVLTHGMKMGNGAVATGTNVLFYNSCTQYATRLPGGCRTGDAFGAIQISGGIDFSAVTPQASGPYQNLTFFADRNNPQPMTISSGAILNAGTVYGKSMPVTITGGATAPVQFLVDSLRINGGSVVTDNVRPDQEFQGVLHVGMTQ